MTTDVPSLPLTTSTEITVVESTTIGRKANEYAAMGVTSKALIDRSTIGPPALRLYAVEPEGVETITPSPLNARETQISRPKVGGMSIENAFDRSRDA